MLRSDKWVWIFIKKFRQILVFCISNHIASKHHHTTAKKWSKKKIKTPVNASSWYGCYFDFTLHGISLKRHWVSKKWKRCNRKKETFLKDEIERINSFSLSLSHSLSLSFARLWIIQMYNEIECLLQSLSDWKGNFVELTRSHFSHSFQNCKKINNLRFHVP